RPPTARWVETTAGRPPARAPRRVLAVHRRRGGLKREDAPLLLVAHRFLAVHRRRRVLKPLHRPQVVRRRRRVLVVHRRRGGMNPRARAYVDRRRRVLAVHRRRGGLKRYTARATATMPSSPRRPPTARWVETL